MGGKMAAASRVVQAVKPHAPLIKFPDRLGSPRPNVFVSVQEALKTMIMTSPPQSTGTPMAQSTVGSVSRPPGPPSSASHSWLPGPPDTASSVRALPHRYRRTTMTEEEMAYIQRGGPE
ncbi:28S ribosomal protein S36, mitochondrial isoform X1 [Polyodon spathula]|uniref:28S ribosomal protein S36, mitochondrial isoform X1 n=1 Tax=Polyodon spathula TaxID=7913 RepID=UPI001B7DD116|nr:28S ribosomal protein S36, mitochondrial isoform X1 [Polyodon spathula]